MYFVIGVLSLVHEVIDNGGIVVDNLLIVVDFVLLQHLLVEGVLIESGLDVVEKAIVTVVVATQRLVARTRVAGLYLGSKGRRVLGVVRHCVFCQRVVTVPRFKRVLLTPTPVTQLHKLLLLLSLHYLSI